MYTILTEIRRHLYSLKPAFLSRNPHFNFITIHYFWIIGMAILGSLCLFIRGGDIRYIDALFFGSGASTQSGLNTININELTTWQQSALLVIAMATNPITINTFVVFLRLYWFEKRFQHIAKEASEASKNRRSIAKTLSKARTEDHERDLEAEERGVGERNIVVMHHTTTPNGMTDPSASPEDLVHVLNVEKERTNAEERSRSSDASGNSLSDKHERQNTADGNGRPGITFADEVLIGQGLDSNGMLRRPLERSTDEHIAFVQRQRKAADDGAVLRIPGPRDADAGEAPRPIDESDPTQQPGSRRGSTFSSVDHTFDAAETMQIGDEQVEPDPVGRKITIAEPTRSPAGERAHEDMTAAKHTLSVLRFRKPRVIHGERLHEEKNHSHGRSNTFQSIRSALSREKEDDPTPYLSWEPTLGRNSAFVNLTEEQREELGGIEYRSLKSLALVLTLYFWGFTVFGIVCLWPWIYTTSYGAIVTNDGQGRGWWGIFTPISAFTDLGFTLTPDSMISFASAIWPLLLMSFLIIIGNTGFPIMLRIIIWVTSRYVPRDSGIYEELKFLLDHPRRCFTLLFPGKATWWLFWILVILNGLDLLFFIVLDLGNTVVTQLPVNIRVLDGWFQAVSTRTAGFGVVNLAALHPAIQVSYMLMMYISVLPIAISVRRTNVYEEKSLGIYGSAAEENEDEGEPSYVGAHLRRQLSFDLWYIFAGFFIISISEGTRLQAGDPAFTLFAVLFEIVSAYGTVGLSLGYTNIDASFSAEFGTIAKLVIIAMQVRGRHRGLPYELDRAILLPSENLRKKEGEEADTRMARRRSSAGTGAASGLNAGDGSGIGRIQTRRESTANKDGRSRSRGPSGGKNFVSSLLHPGPTIPNSHRIGNIDPLSQRQRRTSTATVTTGAGEEENRSEGRRSFFQDGVNPGPNGVKEN